jgi:hypothetical protein
MPEVQNPGTRAELNTENIGTGPSDLNT